MYIEKILKNAYYYIGDSVKQYEIINACSDLGVTIDGANLGPELISKHFFNNEKINNIVSIKKPITLKSKDKKDLKKNLGAVNLFNKNLYNVVDYTIKKGYFPITIGGDHSVVIASGLASLENNDNLGIIWIDAHADFNTFESTKTGNIHGLPLAALCGYKCEKLTNFMTNKHYNTKNVVIVGARSIDDWEYPNLDDTDITIFTTEDIKKHGATEIMEKAIDIASNKTDGIHISYDLDVIDPEVAPGVSVDEENGINEKEAYEIMDTIIENKDKIKSLDLVEFNPKYDINNKTLKIAINLLNKFINN